MLSLSSAYICTAVVLDDGHYRSNVNVNSRDIPTKSFIEFLLCGEHAVWGLPLYHD